MKKLTQILAAALAAGPSTIGLCAAQSYTVVATGQTQCYDNRNEIAPPKPGQPFYGQDAQFQNHPPSYTLSADGLTVHDNNTDLTWQRSPDSDGDGSLTRRNKLSLAQAQALPAKLNAAKFGGFDDWRLPSIKELYSLFDARGMDPSGPQVTDTSGLRPFIDTNYFKFAYGDVRAGERTIDSQWATSTLYVANTNQMFGVNFADGRIKGYGTMMPGRRDKTFFAICVRGNPSYGQNDFHDDGDGTITDHATGLTWSKADSGKGMNWEIALSWAGKKNAEKFLGHDDWRLPSVKELQSIVDYTRSPETTHSPAIAPVFDCTTITNEAGQADFPCYWSGTTHAGLRGGGAAMYVAFGRASGWMSPRGMMRGPPEHRGGFGRGPGPGGLPGGGPPDGGPPGGGPPDGGPPNGGPPDGGPPDGGPPGGGPPDTGAPSGKAGDYHFEDVHGAGAQRSDPKAGDPAMFPHGRGPQGDVIRIFNYVRLVRSGP